MVPRFSGVFNCRVSPGGLGVSWSEDSSSSSAVGAGASVWAVSGADNAAQRSVAQGRRFRTFFKITVAWILRGQE
jgi:hypothetical protein